MSYSNIAEALEELKDYKGALDNYKKALKLLKNKDEDAKDWLISCIKTLKEKAKNKLKFNNE